MELDSDNPPDLLDYAQVETPHAHSHSSKRKENEEKSKEVESDGIFKQRKVIFSKSFGFGEYELTLREFEGIDVDGAVLLEGFPSISLTSILTAGYIADELKLPQVGVISSPGFPPRCLIEKTQPVHPIRILGNSKVVVLQCEFKIVSPHMNAFLIEAILDFAARHKVSMIFTIEGLPCAPNQMADAEKIRYITSEPAFAEFMKKQGHIGVGEGVISGISGLLMAEASLTKYPISCLLAKSSVQYPDARSAVVIVKALDAFLPHLKIGTVKLEEKAVELEKMVNKILAQSNPAAPLSMYS